MIKIVLLGDSTMQYNNALTYPQVGWGQMLPLFFNKEVTFYNFAKNGRSTKKFIDEKRLEHALKFMDRDTYTFIQFGHNDQKIDDVTRYASLDDYGKNLLFFIDEIRKTNATPILLTPIYRRFFDESGHIKDHVHMHYDEKMIEIAKQKECLCIDMTNVTKQVLSDLGDVESKKYFMQFPPNTYVNYPDGMNDNTHLVSDGAYLISKLVVNELIKNNHPIIRYLCIDKEDIY